MKIDYVFPYVNDNDPVWKKEYNKYVGASVPCRFRDNDLLRQKIIGVKKFLTFINKIYILVSSESQLPEWVKKDDKIKIITHSQFIPTTYLPTFNSCTIEMFLHNIPDLSELFIYSNDDFFITSNCQESDFIDSDKPKVFIKEIIKRKTTIFEKTMLNQWQYLCRIFNKAFTIPECRPLHSDTMMIKSFNTKFFNEHKNEITKHISRTRRIDNFNQYLYVEAAFLSGKMTRASFNTKYYNMDKFVDDILSKYKIVVFNDNSKVVEDDITRAQKALNKLYNLVQETPKIKIEQQKRIEKIPTQNIDYVFPFVTMNDPEWLEEYKKYCPKNAVSMLAGKERFEDNGCLKYMFRGLAKNLPWLNKVHMIVMTDSQVPKWVNRETVNIIYHKDFIPQSVLPLFNSSAIEMFMGCLDCVSQRYLYGNDDLYIIKPMNPSQFINPETNKMIKRIKPGQVKFPWDKLRLLDYNLVFNTPENTTKILRDMHSIQIYDKNTINECVAHHIIEITNSLTKFREMDKNFNKYIFDFYDIKNNYAENVQTFKAVSTVIKNIYNRDITAADAICVNDDESGTSYDDLIKFFEGLFPDKCKYEY